MPSAPANETPSLAPTRLVPNDDPALQAVRQALRSVKFGVIQITIHEGRIVQIDKTEKIRLT